MPLFRKTAATTTTKKTLNNNPFDLYYHRRNRCKTKIRCRVCDKELTSQEYDSKNHAVSCLKLNPRIQCIWCNGNVSWPSRKKGGNVNHLHECWEIFMSKVAARLQQSSTVESCRDGEEEEEEEMAVVVEGEGNIRLDNLDHTCEVGDMFGRTRVLLTDDESSSAYYYYYYYYCDRPLYPLEFEEEEYCYNLFRDDNLNSAFECVRLYLKNTHEFNHCMVRAVALKSFIRAMEADGGNARILPFSCWCDGGNDQLSDEYRHHRHFIITYPLNNSGGSSSSNSISISSSSDEEDGTGSRSRGRGTDGQFYKNVWSKIKISREERPYSNYKCIFMKPIESAMHLVNTIGYVSNRRSRCNGTFDRKNKRSEGDYQQKHFWIFKSLPENFRLPLVLLWDGGLKRLLDQNYEKKLPKTFMRAPSRQKNEGMWYIDVGELPDLPKGIVLPVRKNVRFVFEDEMSEGDLESDCCLYLVLYLMRGRRIRVVIDDTLEELDDDDKEWLVKQARGGGCNLFWNVLGSERWKFVPFHQKCFDAVQESTREREADFERIVKEKDEKLERIVKEKDEKLEQIVKEKDEERERIVKEKDTELACLKEKEMEQQSIIDGERQAGVASKRRIKALKSEVERLKKRKLEMHVERLEMVVEKMKREQRENEMRMRKMQERIETFEKTYGTMKKT